MSPLDTTKSHLPRRIGDITWLKWPADGQASSYAALHSISASGSQTVAIEPPAQLLPKWSDSEPVKRALRLSGSPGSQQTANIVQSYETSNGYVHLIDQVLTQPDDLELLLQTSSTPASAGAMSSLLGAHNSALLDAIQSLFTANGITSASTMISLIGALLMAIVLLTGLLLFLVVRRRRQSKLNRHQQLESGLTSSSTASNSGSTSTTKSL